MRNGEISDSEITRRKTTHRGIWSTNQFLAKSTVETLLIWQFLGRLLEKIKE